MSGRLSKNEGIALSRKTNALDGLYISITEIINMTASDVGGLTENEADEWRAKLETAIEDGLEGIVLYDS